MAGLSLEVRQIDLELAERFTIARETWDVAHNVFVLLRYEDVTGVGEVQPADRWDESPDSVVKLLEALDLSVLPDPFAFEALQDLLPAGSARSALDIAMHDLAGKLAGVSLTKLLGLSGIERPATSVTVGIGSVDEMLARAEKVADHPILKVKVGFDGDVEFVTRLRGIYGGTIRIDANEGWSVEQAIERLARLEPLEIELCEQPIPAGDHDALRRVTEGTTIRVFADEDVCTSGDVAQLRGVVDGVNLKLRKCGGITEAVKAMAVARANGMGVMLGCDLVSGVAATAEAHLAALVDHADVDGPLLLTRDPYPGVTYERGRLTVPEGPGLGLSEEPT
jgi:L-alanine-DL-glutamate epimerase-like enolase superfamily enzyme